jgi:hypothetical protein
MLRSKSIRAAALAAACAAVLATAAPALGDTYRVRGKSVTVDAEAGISKMRGGLIGDWTTTSFEELGRAPYYHARGTELFKGCLDRQRDRSCKGDPKGTLELTFEYWGLFAAPDPASLVWGACWHPIVGGTGGFAGAQGVIQMVDTPEDGEARTDYIGNVTLKAGHARRAARASRSSCGATR